MFGETECTKNNNIAGLHSGVSLVIGGYGLGVLYKELSVHERLDAYAAEVAALIKEGLIGVAEVEKVDLRDF